MSSQPSTEPSPSLHLSEPEQASLERRGAPRFQTDHWVHWWKDGESMPRRGHMMNLSAGGCFIEAIQSVPPGTRVIVVLTRALKAEGEVRFRILGRGMGIRFVEIDRKRLLWIAPCPGKFSNAYDEQVAAELETDEASSGLEPAEEGVLNENEVELDRASAHALYLRVLKVVNVPELDFGAIERLIAPEPVLRYWLLRYLNSVGSFRAKIKSIPQALTLLGERDLCRGLMLMCAVLANTGKPLGLIAPALVRGRFCELLAPASRVSESAALMLGLFSGMDLILEASTEAMLEEAYLPAEVTEALLGTSNDLRVLYELALAFESGEASTREELVKTTRVSEGAANQAYAEAVQWVRGLHLS